MTSAKLKKQTEREQLELYNRLTGNFGNLANLGIDWMGESPDVVIPSAEGRIGIEIVEVYQVHEGVASNRSRSAFEDALTKDIVSRLRADQCAPAMISFDFADLSSLRSQEREVFLQRVSQICRETHVPGQVRIWEAADFYDRYDTGKWPIELDVLSSIYIDGQWTNGINAPGGTQAGWVDEDGRSAIQTALNKKEPLIARYRARCDKICILAVIRDREPTTFIEPNADTLSHGFKTSADELHLLAGWGRGYQLKIIH